MTELELLWRIAKLSSVERVMLVRDSVYVQTAHAPEEEEEEEWELELHAATTTILQNGEVFCGDLPCAPYTVRIFVKGAPCKELQRLLLSLGARRLAADV